VIVPGHRRRDDEIAGFHHGLLSGDRRMRALALEDETQCRLGVTMGGGNFAGQHQLHAGIQQRRDFRLPPQAGVFQDEHAAFGFFGGNQAAGFEHARALHPCSNAIHG
jgi:hypothetical protein